MYFKENWQSMAEKEPVFGHVDIFQTSPKTQYAEHEELLASLKVGVPVHEPPNSQCSIFYTYNSSL